MAKNKDKKGFFTEFKEFISKGNIVDMAVGVIIGGAFGKIVSSLVADIITPLISLAVGGQNFSQLFAVLNNPEGKVFATIAEAQEAGFATLNYGAFIQTVIDFLIIALCIFLMLKMIMKAKALAEKAKKKEEEEEAPKEEAPAEPTVEEKTLATLTEIKELLEKNGK
ncbi:MAG: large conductance mechanosensitive channel protein MscL [Clostridia bacterium]|nr:large conductance mechanosensitive channel protein MscL [Clostridia bacterium]